MLGVSLEKLVNRFLKFFHTQVGPAFNLTLAEQAKSTLHQV